MKSRVRSETIAFESGAVTLRGALLLPDGDGPHPAVVVTHGLSVTRDVFGAHDYPGVFAEAGFAVLVYDHPSTGESDGEPRGELDPLGQERGYEDAVTFLCLRPDVDSSRIGLWGTSYSGGAVLAVASRDRRVACVVVMVPTISGYTNTFRRNSPEEVDDLRAVWAADRCARALGNAAATRPAFAEGGEGIEWMLRVPEEHRRNWVNRVTLRTLELYSSWEPAAFVERISPTPLMMICALDDVRTPTEDARSAFARVGEPKEFVDLPGGHHSVYEDQFAPAVAAARRWFLLHLS